MNIFGVMFWLIIIAVIPWAILGLLSNTWSHLTTGEKAWWIED